MRLRFQIGDDSGQAAIVVDVWRKSANVLHRSFPLQSVDPATTYYVTWSSRSAGVYRFCVSGRDAAGQATSACARVVVDA